MEKITAFLGLTLFFSFILFLTAESQKQVDITKSIPLTVDKVNQDVNVDIKSSVPLTVDKINIPVTVDKINTPINVNVVSNSSNQTRNPPFVYIMGCF